jgi:hypothetical protein
VKEPIELSPKRKMASMCGLIADPAQLAILRGAVHAYCEKHGIMDAAARERVAGQVLDLFFLGVTEPSALVRGLERRSSDLGQSVASAPGGLLLGQNADSEAYHRENLDWLAAEIRKAG